MSASKKQNKMELKEHLTGTQFELELANALLQFVPKHMQECLNNPELKYSKYGTERELKLKEILRYYTNFYTVLNDLELAIQFLNKERKLILVHYPKLESQEAYYNYHYENYFIRMATFNDILGRLGTLTYSLEIKLEKSSAYIFKDKARQEGYDEISTITERLINKIDQLKQERHKKLHIGEADIKLLNGIVIWEDLMARIGSETDEILQEQTNNEIEAEIEKLINETIEIVKIIKEFLESSTKKLKEIINTNS